LFPRLLALPYLLIDLLDPEGVCLLDRLPDLLVVEDLPLDEGLEEARS